MQINDNRQECKDWMERGRQCKEEITILNILKKNSKFTKKFKKKWYKMLKNITNQCKLYNNLHISTNNKTRQFKEENINGK